MEKTLLTIINGIRETKQLRALTVINKADRLREDLGLTSFDLAELTVKLEDEFDIDIFEDGLVSTVGEIIAKLEN